jgi:drug/metabolite transporter (DMT)-like permease
VTDVAPVTFAAARLAVAALVLVPIVALSGGWRLVTKSDLVPIAASGVLLLCVNYVLQRASDNGPGSREASCYETGGGGGGRLIRHSAITIAITATRATMLSMVMHDSSSHHPFAQAQGTAGGSASTRPQTNLSARLFMSGTTISG